MRWPASVAATQKATEMHMGGAAHALHAMDFLEYAYLQIGDDAKAKAMIAQMDNMQEMDMGDGMPGYLGMARAAFPATYAIETRNWKDAAALKAIPSAKPYNAAIVYWAQAVGYGHLHDSANAHKAVAQYDAMVEATMEEEEEWEE